MLSQQGSPTWQPRAKACSRALLRRVDVPVEQVELDAERLRPRLERGQAPRRDEVEGLVEDAPSVLELAAEQVEAAQHGAGLRR
jgi:hypothetical protein